MLGEPIKGGKSKVYHLKELERYLEYKKEGQKFVITKIYDIEKTKELTKRSKYIQEIENILVAYLSKTDINEEVKVNRVLSLGSIIEILGMANNTYSVGNRHRSELGRVLNIDTLCVYYFYNNTRSEFKSIIERALNNLQKRRILNWHKSVVIYYQSKGVKHYKMADADEESKIIDIEKKVLNEMGFRDGRDLFLSGKRKEFQRRVKSKLPLEWIYYFYGYNIVIGKNAVLDEAKNIREEKIKLNKKIKKRSHEKLKVIGEGSNNHKLIDKLIDIVKYDESLDKAIIDEYKNTIKAREEKIKEKHKDLSKIDDERNSILQEIDDIRNSYNDDIGYSQYIGYAKNKKNLHEILELSFVFDGVDEKLEYLSQENLYKIF